MSDAQRQPSALGGKREGVVLRLARGFPAADFQDSVCKITREAVLAVIRGEVGTGMRRGAIIEALGVKGNWSGEVAVDNRLRELKKQGSVLHEGHLYRCW